MKEFTVERNLMDVSNVGKPTLIPVTFILVKELTLERNSMDVSNVEKISINAPTFMCTEVLTPYVYMQCDKAFSHFSHL
jgi:hypothetical protein